MKGKQQQEWLREVDLDQNIQGLEQIEQTIKNEETRKWFLSQMLAGNVAFARYNPVTGFIELGAEDRNAHTFVLSTTSAQNTDFVIPDGQVWEVVGIAARDLTTGSSWRWHYWDGATAHSIPCNQVMTAAVTTQQSIGMFHKTRVLGNGTIAIRATAVNFVAADNLSVMLTYRRVQ